MKEYSHAELNQMFERAIEDMAKRGILSPTKAKEYLKNIKQWLLETLEV